MSETAKVLLITGPAGSGKSTLGQSVAEKLGWQFISEDEYWVKNGWLGERTEEQEQQVQSEVNKHLLEQLHSGKSTVLEFILYKEPPNALSNYQETLDDDSVPFTTVVLKPSVDELMNRLTKRGRHEDVQDMEGRKRFAQHQVSILERGFVKPEWVIDPTDMTVDALYNTCLRRIYGEDQSAD